MKAVTLEVDVIGAQKISLAASVGSLSLMLRKAGEANNQYTRRITLSDLGAPTDADRRRQTGRTASPRSRCARASTREEYSVPVEELGFARSAADGDRLAAQTYGTTGKAKTNGWGVGHEQAGTGDGAPAWR